LTSPYERPDRPLLEQLEHLLEGVEAELAAWRARATKAEQELGPVRSRAGAGHAHAPNELQQARHRIGMLEGENQALRQRISAAREQVERLRTRLRFVEEHDAGSVA
jgi:chromosome segregation ATPase